MGQLVLLGQDGKTLWQGPKRSASVDFPTEPEIFLGQLDLGTLEAIGDLAGDGRLLLLGTYQKSDVSRVSHFLREAVVCGAGISRRDDCGVSGIHKIGATT